LQNQTFLTARSIGMPYKFSGQKVNLLLLEKGLIDGNRIPTPKAKGLVQTYQLRCGLTAYKWDRDFVDDLIEEHLKANPPQKKKRRGKAKN
jgi:hypothetical protein